MNNKNLRTIMFIIIGVLILGVFLKILPYIIIGGIGIYLVSKGYKFIKAKVNQVSNTESTTYTYDSKDNIESKSDVEFDTSNAIDVDYKEVK